jgi:hypothetical protein
MQVQEFDLPHAVSAHAQLGTILLVCGDLAGGETSLAHAVACGASAQPGLALLHLAQGDTQAASASMGAAHADTHMDAVTRGRLLPAAVDIALAVRDETAAELAAAELQGLAEGYATAVLQASAATVRGALALYRGDSAASVRELRGATHIWRSGIACARPAWSSSTPLGRSSGCAGRSGRRRALARLRTHRVGLPHPPGVAV